MVLGSNPTQLKEDCSLLSQKILSSQYRYKQSINNSEEKLLL